MEIQKNITKGDKSQTLKPPHDHSTIYAIITGAFIGLSIMLCKSEKDIFMAVLMAVYVFTFLGGYYTGRETIKNQNDK